LIEMGDVGEGGLVEVDGLNELFGLEKSVSLFSQLFRGPQEPFFRTWRRWLEVSQRDDDGGKQLIFLLILEGTVYLYFCLFAESEATDVETGVYFFLGHDHNNNDQ